jgi:hypothetical protein
MRARFFFSLLTAGLMMIVISCGNRGLKSDADKIGDAMCRNIEVMNKMKVANPMDTAAIGKLRIQSEKLQNEMTSLYKAFNEKYKEKIKDPAFVKDFNRELRKAMLECAYLSKTDRELFEKEINE